MQKITEEQVYAAMFSSPIAMTIIDLCIKIRGCFSADDASNNDAKTVLDHCQNLIDKGLIMRIGTVLSSYKILSPHEIAERKLKRT